MATPNPPETGIYLMYDYQKHGPYSASTLVALINKGEIPKDASYWIHGMAQARPVAELIARKKTADEPASHHYLFTYHWVPMLVFGSPSSPAVCRTTKEQLLGLWALAGQKLPQEAHDPPDGLDCGLQPFSPGTELLLITLPAPRCSTEGYLIAVVFPTRHDVSKIRYFVLSHSDANKNAGMPPGCIRELTADGTNSRSKDFVKPTREDFIAAIRELTKQP